MLNSSTDSSVESNDREVNNSLVGFGLPQQSDLERTFYH